MEEQSGNYISGKTSTTNVPDYLVYSILIALFCCLPLGIIAIVFSTQVNAKISAGDMEGAKDSSNKARLFCWLAFGFGGGVFIVAFALSLLGMFPYMMLEM